MKGSILILLGLLCACMAESPFMLEVPEQLEAEEHAVAFIKGFLKGIHEKHPVDDILKCLTDISDVIAQIKKALDLIEKMDYEHLVQGFKLLVEALKNLEKKLEPCFANYAQIKKLMNSLKHINIMRIVMKVLLNPSAFIKDVTAAIEAFKREDFFTVGKCTGDILYRLFLSRSSLTTNPIQELMEGFLKGIREEKSIEDLLKCMKHSEEIIEKIKEAISLIRKFTIESILEGFSMLFEALYQLEEMLMPCLEGFDQFKKLLIAIKNADFDEILEKIFLNAVQFLADIIDCIRSFEKKNYYKAGYCIADILYRLFLENDAIPTGFDVGAFFKGFLQGLNEKGDVKDLLKCVKNAEAIVKKIIEAIKLIQKMKIENLIQGITMLIDAVQQLIAMIKPCSNGFGQIQKLIKAITHINIMKIIIKILSNPGPIVSNVVQAIDAAKRGQWEKFGFNIGQLLFRIFLSSRAEALSISKDDAIAAIMGFLEGSTLIKYFDNAKKCIEGGNEIFVDIIEIIEEINSLDWKDIAELGKLLMKTIKVVKTLLEDLINEHCVNSVEELKKVISDMSKTFENGGEEFINRVRKNALIIGMGIYSAINDLSNGAYKSFGNNMGNIVLVLFLQAH